MIVGPPSWALGSWTNAWAAGSWPAAFQYARPIADLSAGGWTPSAGTDLYAVVNEVTADDATYIRSGA